MSKTKPEAAEPDTYETDTREVRDRLIRAALPHVPFDGWTMAALNRAAKDIGLTVDDAKTFFPGIGRDMVAWHSQMADREMLASLAEQDLEGMKIRDRIATAVMTRLMQHEPDREAVRRGLALLTLPQNSGLALRLLYRTVDDMWFAAGDRSTDWNFYSKRALLAGVYSSTLLVWLNDHSEDFVETRAFLARRIEDVMKVPKVKARLAKVADIVPARLRAFQSFGRMRGAR